MYFSIFPLSEYSFDEDINNNLKIDEELCIICWEPTEENNKIKYLSHFSHIITTCKCNPKIHSLCLDIWIKQNHSCPICISTIINNTFKTDKNNILSNCFIYCVQYTIIILKYFVFLCYPSFLKLFFVCFLSCYILSYLLIKQLSEI